MGRHRKPVAEHVRDGTYRADRHGPVPEPEPPAPPPERPADLAGGAAEFWDRVLLLIGPTLRPADGPQLVQMCRWWARWVECEAALDAEETPGTVEHSRLIKAAATCSASFDRIASRFGLTPADRAKLRSEAPAQAKAKVATRPATKLDRQGPPTRSKKR